MYEAATQKKIPKTKRISVGVTDEEYAILDELAHQRKTTKSKLIYGVLAKMSQCQPN